MNRFMAFVRKEFLHIFRDWRSMLVLLAYPVILVLLFGFAVTTEVKNVRVGILDMSEDGITRKIVDRIAANPYMTVVSQTKDIRTIYDNFDRGKTDVALVLGNNFAMTFCTPGVPLCRYSSTVRSLTRPLYASNTSAEYFRPWPVMNTAITQTPGQQ